MRFSTLTQRIPARLHSAKPYQKESYMISRIGYVLIVLLCGLLLVSCTLSQAPAEIEAVLPSPHTSPLVTEGAVAPNSPLDFPADSIIKQRVSTGFPQASILPVADGAPEILPVLRYFTFVGPIETPEPNRYYVWHWTHGESTLVAEVEFPWNECLEMKLSPTGRYLACMAPATLYVVALDEQAEPRIVSVEELAGFATGESIPVSVDWWREDDPPIGFNTFLWLPDSERILFSTRAEGFYQRPNEDLYLLEVATGELSRLFAVGQGGARLTLGPDGQFVAVVSPTQVQLLRTDTLEVVNQVAYEAIEYDPGMPLYAALAWQGAEAAVVLAPPSIDARPWTLQQEVLGGPETQIWRIPVNGTSPGLLGIAPGRHLLRLSPGAEYLLYWTLQATQSGQSIYELHYFVVDTGEAGLVYTGAWMEFMGWLPGGRSFLLGEAANFQVQPTRLVDIENRVWRPWVARHVPWGGPGWPGTDWIISPDWVDERTFVVYSPKGRQAWLETIEGQSYPLFETDTMILGLYLE
jgi:hypothetical protein